MSRTQPKAPVTGITGQDGSYLAEFLLKKNCCIYGLMRRSSTITFERINHLRDQIDLINQLAGSTLIDIPRRLDSRPRNYCADDYIPCLAARVQEAPGQEAAIANQDSVQL